MPQWTRRSGPSAANRRSLVRSMASGSSITFRVPSNGPSIFIKPLPMAVIESGLIKIDGPLLGTRNVIELPLAIERTSERRFAALGPERLVH